jgi:molybdate transport system substrate-binding protein
MVRRSGSLALVAVLVFLGAAACGRERGVTVSAAISLKEPLEEVRAHFAADHAGVAVRLNLGGSGELTRQILAGAPIDVFVSASEAHLDEIERAGLCLPGSRRLIATNLLTLVGPQGGPPLARPEDLLGPAVRRIAVGNPRTVPAGEYASQWLRHIGLWDRLGPKLVFTENVRQALDYAARGEVEAAVVYATDVRGGQVRAALQPAPGSHAAIRYSAAALRGAADPALARAFVERLTGTPGQAALARHGFLGPVASR